MVAGNRGGNCVLLPWEHVSDAALTFVPAVWYIKFADYVACTGWRKSHSVLCLSMLDALAVVSLLSCIAFTGAGSCTGGTCDTTTVCTVRLIHTTEILVL